MATVSTRFLGIGYIDPCIQLKTRSKVDDADFNVPPWPPPTPAPKFPLYAASPAPSRPSSCSGELPALNPPSVALPVASVAVFAMDRTLAAATVDEAVAPSALVTPA